MIEIWPCWLHPPKHWYQLAEPVYVDFSAAHFVDDSYSTPFSDFLTVHFFYLLDRVSEFSRYLSLVFSKKKFERRKKVNSNLWVNNFNRSSPTSLPTTRVSSFNLAWDENWRVWIENRRVNIEHRRVGIKTSKLMRISLASSSTPRSSVVKVSSRLMLGISISHV